jgi:hypothetical protein
VWVAILLAVVAIAEAPFAGMWIWDRVAFAGSAVEANTSGLAAFGTVHVETAPAGMEVWVNGGAAGRTPTQLSILVGAAEIQLRHADRVHTVPLTIASGEVVRLRVELPAAVEESVELTDGVADTPIDMVVVVSAQAEDLALIVDPAVEVPSAERDSTALALAQPSLTP